MTQTEYLQAAVMMKASGRAKIRLARANCFDVIGGVTEGELQLLEPLGPGDRLAALGGMISAAISANKQLQKCLPPPAPCEAGARGDGKRD